MLNSGRGGQGGRRHPDHHARMMGTEDAREGIRSFVERRKARFVGR